MLSGCSEIDRGREVEGLRWPREQTDARMLLQRAKERAGAPRMVCGYAWSSTITISKFE